MSMSYLDVLSYYISWLDYGLMNGVQAYYVFFFADSAVSPVHLLLYACLFFSRVYDMQDNKIRLF